MLRSELHLEPATGWGHGTLHDQRHGAEVVGTTALAGQARHRLSQRHDHPPIGRGPQQGRVVSCFGLLDFDDRSRSQRVPSDRPGWFAPYQAARTTLACDSRVSSGLGRGREYLPPSAGLWLQHLERAALGCALEEDYQNRLRRRSIAANPPSREILGATPQAHHERQAERGRIRAGQRGAGTAKKGAGQADSPEALIYQDEVEIHRHPTLCRMWARKGHQPSVPAPGQNEKRVVYGGVDYATGRITYTIAASKSGANFLAFLIALVTAY